MRIYSRSSVVIFRIRTEYHPILRLVLTSLPLEMYIYTFRLKEEMFYLTTHSTHFIYSYMASDTGERERNVLFNDTLNTFYLRLYGVRHMVTDHSDSEKGNPLLPHRLLLSINSKGSFICTIPQTG